MSKANRSQGVVHILEEHVHSQSYVAPNLAAAVTLTANAAAWNNTGVLVELIAAGAVTEAFDIHWAQIVGGNNAQYQIGLYAGGVGSESLITSFPFERVGVQTSTAPINIMCAIQPPGTRISARVASSVGGATATIKIQYHTY